MRLLVILLAFSSTASFAANVVFEYEIILPDGEKKKFEVSKKTQDVVTKVPAWKCNLSTSDDENTLLLTCSKGISRVVSATGCLYMPANAATLQLSEGKKKARITIRCENLDKTAEGS
jgi:hypothetical protein